MTKQQLILNSLLSGEKLTTLDAIVKFRTVDLRKRISDLRRLGFPIQDKWETNKKSRFKSYFI